MVEEVKSLDDFEKGLSQPFFSTHFEKNDIFRLVEPKHIYRLFQSELSRTVGRGKRVDKVEKSMDKSSHGNVHLGKIAKQIEF